MTRVYKNHHFQRIYDACMIAARDRSSEFYLPNGEQRTGAMHRCAFWDGYNNGTARSAHASPGTLAWICHMAGRDFRKEQTKNPWAARHWEHVKPASTTTKEES